jgi:uncharacterized protein
VVRLPLNLVPKTSLHIAVFCKPLIRGQVKTRLIAHYGSQGATAIYAQLVEHTLKTVHTSCVELDASASLWVAGDITHASVIDWANRFSLVTYEQCGGDLGEKMHYCLSNLARNYPRVLLIGTDCPGLAPADLRAAAASLSGACPWVFTPAEDGGYVLVGTSAPSPLPFRQIEWSTPLVMAQTRKALSSGELTWRELPALWDVDEPEDVERARIAGWVESP